MIGYTKWKKVIYDYMRLYLFQCNVWRKVRKKAKKIQDQRQAKDKKLT